MRRWPSLLLMSAACSPGAFDDLVSPARSAIDGGSVQPVDAGIDAHTRDLDAASSDAASGDASAVDTVPALDPCGQLPPTPAQIGIEDGGVVFAGTIVQDALVSPRQMTSVLAVDDDYWWVFADTFPRGTLLISPTDSITSSASDAPYSLREAAPDAGIPLPLLPALDADLAMLASNEQLTHSPGTLLATGPHDALLFYGPGALWGADGGFASRSFGTRVAHVHIEDGQAQATPEPTFVFGPELPLFRFGVIADGYVYLYGCRTDAFGTSDCTVARAPTALATTGANYQFRTTSGWSNNFSDATYVLNDASDELSITFNPFLGRYIATHFKGLASQINLDTAPQPDGPWEPLGTIAVPPPISDKIWHTTALEHSALATLCARKLELTYLYANLYDNSELRRIEVLLREGTR